MSNQVQVRKEQSAPATSGNGDLWQSFRHEMDRVFDRMNDNFGLKGFPRIEHFWPQGSKSGCPAVDMTGDDKAYKVTAEFPGVDTKDVEVTLGDDYLSVKAEKNQSHEDKTKDRYVSERSYGLLERTFALPTDIDRDAIDAKFEKGVLTVTLPKTAKSQPNHKKIEVKAA
jgi:HSP20 family protein